MKKILSLILGCLLIGSICYGATYSAFKLPVNTKLGTDSLYYKFNPVNMNISGVPIGSGLMMYGTGTGIISDAVNIRRMLTVTDTSGNNTPAIVLVSANSYGTVESGTSLSVSSGEGYIHADNVFGIYVEDESSAPAIVFSQEASGNYGTFIFDSDTSRFFSSNPIIGYGIEGKISSTTINTKLTGTTEIFTVPNNGTCAITKIIGRVTTDESTTVGATVSFGSNADSYDDFKSNSVLGLLSTGSYGVITAPTVEASVGKLYTAGTKFVINVSSAVTGTAQTIVFDTFGVLY